MRGIGIRDFMERNFDTYPFEGEWKATFGEPEKNFKMILYGRPGNGKTEFSIKLAKYLTQWARVYYNTFEQGISKSLQDALVRNDMMDVNGRVIFGDRESFEEMCERLSHRNSPRIVIIDSRDYMNLTTQQFKTMCERFPQKAIVVICWESGGKPKGEYAKAIEFMCDIKARVYEFKVEPRSRFGGNAPFAIWPDRPKKAAGQVRLFL